MKKYYLIISLFFSCHSNAHNFIQYSTCREVSIPFDLVDQSIVDKYNNEVKEYKYCLNSFIEDQQKNIEIHQNSAIKAKTDWDNFIKKQNNLWKH